MSLFIRLVEKRYEILDTSSRHKCLKRWQTFILLTFFGELLSSVVMKNILNQLLKSLLLVLSLVVVSPSAFAAEDVKLQFRKECKHAGHYKVIITNGWADQAFPMPVSSSKAEWVQPGETKVFEVTKGGLDLIIKMLNSQGVYLNIAPGSDNMKPEDIGYISDPEMPENEKYTLILSHCLKGRCDIEKHSIKNCAGHMILDYIDGHPVSQEELIKRRKELGIKYIIDANSMTFVANATETSHQEL